MKYYANQNPTFDDIIIEYDENVNFFKGLEATTGINYADMKHAEVGYGSGFIITPNGHILTNAHVGAMNLSYLENVSREVFLLAYFTEIQNAYSSWQTSEEEYSYQLALMYFMEKRLNITINNLDKKVVLGVDNAEKGLVSEEYTPELIAYEGGDSMNVENGLDWALLKINKNNLPYLNLGNSDEINVGSEIALIGYPSVSETTYTTELLNQTFRKDVYPTLSKGYISSIKEIGSGYKSFQADISMTGGNSGGPAIDKKGNVIGIATYGLVEYAGGNYNYILRINDIREKIKEKVTLPTKSSSYMMYIIIGIIIAVIGTFLIIRIKVRKNKKR